MSNWLNQILIFFLLCFLSQYGTAQFQTTEFGSAVYPENIRYSYSLGLIHNGFVPEEIQWKFAAIVVERNYSVSERIRVLGKSYETYYGEESTVEQFIAEPFPVDYLEIPVAELKKRGLFESIQNQEALEFNSPLQFKKNGVDYIRWFVHPLRTDTDQILKAFHRKQFLRGRFRAQFTESRSLIVFDSKSGGIWSIKTSLPRGQSISSGEDKTFLFKGAAFHVRLSQVIRRLEKKRRIKPKTYQVELAAIGFSNGLFNEGQAARSIHELADRNIIFVPGSAFYKLGLAHFIPGLPPEQHLEQVKALIASSAEKNATLQAETGFVQTANHSQNSGVLINLKTGATEPLNRDPDVELNTVNPKADLYLSLFRDWGVLFKKDLSYRPSNEMGDLAYRHHDLKSLYFAKFTMTYSTAFGSSQVAPVLILNERYPYMNILDLNIAALSKSEDQLRQIETEMYARAASVETQKYFEQLLTSSDLALTEILLEGRLDGIRSSQLAMAIKQYMAVETPDFWVRYLNRINEQLGSPIPKNHLSEKASVGFENIQLLASHLMTAENKKLSDGVLGKLTLHFTASGRSNLCLSLFN